jgi:hypothetical protein
MLHASAMVDLLTAAEKAPDIRHRLGAWRPKSLSRSSAAQDTDRCDRFPVGTIVWTSPRGRTYTTTPTVALLFSHLGVPTETLQLPNSPPPSPYRELAMPTRNRTRDQDRAYRVERERALNRARPAALLAARHFTGCSTVIGI